MTKYKVWYEDSCGKRCWVIVEAENPEAAMSRFRVEQFYAPLRVSKATAADIKRHFGDVLSI